MNKHTSKYSNLVRNNKIEIPLPDLEKLKTVVEKDIDKLNKKIEDWQNKINLKSISEVEKYKNWIGQAADFAIIKNRLEKIVKDFPTMVEEIKKIWTEESYLKLAGEYSTFSKLVPTIDLSEDELRVVAPFYSIKFENGWQEFYEVGSHAASNCGVFEFVQKTMPNTLKYLGKFGCVICEAGSDCEALETNSCHPWLKKI